MSEDVHFTCETDDEEELESKVINIYLARSMW